MQLLTTTALVLALGSATAASAGPAAIDTGLASATQAPVERVQYYYPDPYYGPGPYYAPGYYYGAPYYGPGWYGPAAVGAAVGGLAAGVVGGAVAAGAAAAAPVVVAPGAPAAAASAADDIAYCQRRFRSYDVRSQTYLGTDGSRHPCPQ
jgi:hypothetical protein